MKNQATELALHETLIKLDELESKFGSTKKGRKDKKKHLVEEIVKLEEESSLRTVLEAFRKTKQIKQSRNQTMKRAITSAFGRNKGNSKSASRMSIREPLLDGLK